MGCQQSSPNSISAGPGSDRIKRAETGEQASQRKLKEKKDKIRGIQLIGQGLPPDFQYKAFPKTAKETEFIRRHLQSSELLKELGGEQLTQVINAF